MFICIFAIRTCVQRTDMLSTNAKRNLQNASVLKALVWIRACLILERAFSPIYGGVGLKYYGADITFKSCVRISSPGEIPWFFFVNSLRKMQCEILVRLFSAKVVVRLDVRFFVTFPGAKVADSNLQI